MEIIPISTEEQEESAKAIELNVIVTDSIELLSDYRHVSSAREGIEMFWLLGLDADDINLVLENILEPETNKNILSLPLLNGLKEGET